MMAIRLNAATTKVDGIAADFSGPAGAEAVIAKLSAVDVLVNNVGIFEPKPFAEIPDADWYRLFEINVMSGVRLSRHYHIFTTADPSVTTHNKALSKLHNQTWMGNIVVVALDKRTQSKVVQFPTRDIGLVDILISV